MQQNFMYGRKMPVYNLRENIFKMLHISKTSNSFYEVPEKSFYFNFNYKLLNCTRKTPYRYDNATEILIFLTAM